MRTSDCTCEVFGALAKFQEEVGTIPKGDDNPFFKSKYAGLPSVVEKARPILTKHGLLVVQTVGSGDTFSHDGDFLTTRVAHVDSGEWFEDDAKLHLGDKDTAQSHGSAVTYLRRYGYVTALGLICDEDDDGNAASLHDTASTRTPTEGGAKRKRRTKAEIAADNAAAGTSPVPVEEELPVPAGWETREICVAAHNELAGRIAALKPEDVAKCVEYRNEHGWPVDADTFETLTAMVVVFEANA